MISMENIQGFFKKISKLMISKISIPKLTPRFCEISKLVVHTFVIF